ncbi:MAG: GNAT family N-acetyltransferase [Actinomycetota bacterium]|nr:GNAT family N-acetyltransferase [Actinomycetota bacterium]
MPTSPEIPPIRVLRSLDDIDPGRWNALNPASFRFSHPWLSYVAAGPFDAEPAFAVAEEDGAYVGGFAAYLIREEHFFLINPPKIVLDDGLDALVGDFYSEEEHERAAALRDELRELREASYPCAVCVSPFGYRVALETRRGRGDVLVGLLDRFEELAREWGARSKAILFVPTQGYEELETAAGRHGYRRAAIAARCVLDAAWPTFEAYVNSFGSDRRRKIKRELRCFDEAGLTLELLAGPELDEDLLPELAALSACVQAKYGHRGDASREEAVLRSLLASLGEHTRFFIVRREGEPVSYMRGFEWGDTFHAASTGERHSALGPRTYAHFKVGYYAPIEHAITHGLRAVDWGVGAYETKLHRGARLEPLTGFFAFDDRADDRVGELLELIDRAQNRLVASGAR